MKQETETFGTVGNTIQAQQMDISNGDVKMNDTQAQENQNIDASLADESQPFKHALLDDTQSQPLTSGMMFMNQSKTGGYQSGPTNGKNANNGETLGSLFQGGPMGATQFMDTDGF